MSLHDDITKLIIFDEDDPIPEEPDPKESPKETTKETPAEAVKEVIKETPKEAPAETAKEAIKETPKEVPAEAAKEVIKETPKEAPAETAKEVIKETPKEAPAETAKEVIKETPKEASVETTKEAIKEIPTETTKEIIKEAIKEVIKEISVATPAEATKEAIKETPKEAPVETAKKVIKETPKKAPTKTAKASDSANKKESLPDDNVDDYVYARYRRSHSHSGHHSHRHSYHYGKDHSSSEKVVASTSSTHYRDKKGRRKKDKKNRPWWKKLLRTLAWIFGVILALLLCLVIVVTTSCHCGLKTLTDYTHMDMTAPEIDSSLRLKNNGKQVSYKGVTYNFNPNVTSILCMGVDKKQLGTDGLDSGADGGQADAIYMISIDTKTGETNVIAISRDIVTDIGIYSAKGEYLGTEKKQLCLAYAYGDGKKTSCTNTSTAVSRLFYQLPINTYFAFDISAIAELNDAVGGVTVTMTDDTFYDTNHVQHFTGETLTLYGDDARKYVQQREVSQLESSTDRMSRQINYLEAFTSKALSMTKKDLSTPLTLYNIVENRSATNLTPSTITALASCMVTNGVSDVDFVKTPGKITSNGTYAEYIVDETALYEMILDIYYTPNQQ